MGVIYRFCNIAFEYHEEKYYYRDMKKQKLYGPFDTEQEMKDSYNENKDILDKGVNYGK